MIRVSASYSWKGVPPPPPQIFNQISTEVIY